MNGYELAERIRPLRPSMKIVFMSDYSDRVKLNTGAADRMDAYLSKPFSAEALTAKVFDVLGAPRSAGTVLVVDDEPATRNFLRKILAEAGYRVAEASNGADAVRYIEASDVDLMITDLAMPEQEGIETIQMLRRSRPRLKTIAISGQFGASMLRAAECLGAHASLAKPVQPDELLEAVARVMHGEAA
jgi:CheY-like chemotaxis protein